MTVVYENPWFKVIKEGNYHFIKENGADNGAVILAKIAGKFVCVKIKRRAHDLVSLEFPRGSGEGGETSAACAARELREETGYRVDAADLTRLGTVRPNTAILASAIPVYLLESDRAHPGKPEGDEVSDIVYVAEEDLPGLIATGQLTDGISLAALALYWARQVNRPEPANA